jgi:hypothetical protein
MYQLSRAIYRELATYIDESDTRGPQYVHERVLHSCEEAITRLVTDRHYFARPARTLFNDIRTYFPMTAQSRVWHVVHAYMTCAEGALARAPTRGFDAVGRPLRCRATTRRGTPCRREPLPINGYCPSHQHLADTENGELVEGMLTASHEDVAVAA